VWFLFYVVLANVRYGGLCGLKETPTKQGRQPQNANEITPISILAVLEQVPVA
jgi:hypothetical protein